MRKILFLIVLGVILSSCATTKPLYNWKGYDEAVYDYTKTNTTKSTEQLENVYQQLIANSSLGSRNIPAPGICADYGYLLIKEGKTDEGIELIKKEISLYPESKPFLSQILKRFEK